MGSYNALAIANYLLDKAKADGRPLTPMQLHKLIYFAHGWHMSLYGGKPLINEQIQAWDYGPVVASVYHEFKNYGSNPIDTLGTDLDIKTFEITTPRVPLDDKVTVALLDKIYQIYGKYTGIQLSNLTHEAGTAWSSAREQAAKENLRSIAIPNGRIKEDFDKQRVAKQAV
jgi:uncharacterized phage-associated protein